MLAILDVSPHEVQALLESGAQVREIEYPVIVHVNDRLTEQEERFEMICSEMRERSGRRIATDESIPENLAPRGEFLGFNSVENFAVDRIVEHRRKILQKETVFSVVEVEDPKSTIVDEAIAKGDVRVNQTVTIRRSRHSCCFDPERLQAFDEICADAVSLTVNVFVEKARIVHRRVPPEGERIRPSLHTHWASHSIQRP